MRCASHTSAAVTRLFRHGLRSKNIVPPHGAAANTHEEMALAAAKRCCFHPVGCFLRILRGCVTPKRHLHHTSTIRGNRPASFLSPVTSGCMDVCSDSEVKTGTAHRVVRRADGGTGCVWITRTLCQSHTQVSLSLSNRSVSSAKPPASLMDVPVS